MQLLKRVLTAVVLIPIVLLLVLRAPIPLLALVAAIIALLAVYEFLKLAESYAVRPFYWPTYIFIGVFFLLLAIGSDNAKPVLSTGVFIYGIGFAASFRRIRIPGRGDEPCGLEHVLSCSSRFGLWILLRGPAAGISGAIARTVVRRFLAFVLAAHRVGRGYLCLLCGTIAGPSSDVAAHQS